MSDTNITTGGVQNQNQSETEGLMQLVVFTLDAEEYAVPITDLQEIIKVPDITPIPNAPHFIKGILNLRGKIVVVIDLEKRFRLVREEARELKHIIITEINKTSFGVVVDEVIEVLTIPVKSVQPTPALVSSKIHADYLKGVVVLKGGQKVNHKSPSEAPKLVIGGDSKSTDQASVDKTGKNESRAVAASDSRLLILIDLSKILHEKELLAVTESVERVSGEEKRSISN